MIDQSDLGEEPPPKAPPSPDSADAPEPVQAQEAVEDETRELTPEEQMALYEEALKESDWGHQPC